MKKIGILLLIFVAFLLSIFLINPFSAPSADKRTQIVSFDGDPSFEEVALKLREGGFIKSFSAFDFAIGLRGDKSKIKEGGYYLSKNMDTWQIISELNNGPKLIWVSIPEGLRKEQIGELLQSALGWSDEELKNWDDKYTAMKYDYIEGVYFPDTYLIPKDESGLEIANRMISHFNEVFAPYFDQFAKKNIVWTTGLRLASIVQREAASSEDMPLISGILWNRLLAGQKLDIDATVQYAKGKVDGKWWPVITGADIQSIDSPYNTYKYTGLPPHPISNPGIAAIDAVLNPTDTKCLYYLHDHSRQIHCSVTYAEHLKNIEKYLNQ